MGANLCFSGSICVSYAFSLALFLLSICFVLLWLVWFGFILYYIPLDICFFWLMGDRNETSGWGKIPRELGEDGGGKNN